MNEFYCNSKISDRISKTPEGFLVCHDVPITLAADMYYTAEEAGIDTDNPKDVVKVSKPINEIHSKATMSSFEGKPITLGHPEDEDGNSIFVTPENSRNLSRGVIQNVRPGSGKDNNKMVADFLITDKEAIDIVSDYKMREVSIGYKYEPGNIDGDSFDQENIRGNHVAIVKAGRAGPACAIFDSKEEKQTMSLKKKLKEAVGIFSKAVDEAVIEDSSVDEKKKSEDESSVAVEANDKAMVKISDRISSMESVCADMASQIKEISESLKSSDEEEKKEEEKEEEKKEDEPCAADSDTLSKAEVLCPGISKEEKDIKRKALDECYKTEIGKGVVDTILSGKSFDSADKDILFNAAASLLSEKRSQTIKAASSFDSSKSTKKKGWQLTSLEFNTALKDFHSKKN